MKNSWKKTAAFVLAFTLVAAPMTANGGVFKGGNEIVAYADGTMVGQHFKLPAQRSSTTISFPGASASNPIYIQGINTITSENVELRYPASGSFWEVYLNGTRIYHDTPAAPLGILINGGSGTQADPYTWIWNYNRGNGAKLSDFHPGDVFYGNEISFTESSFTLPAMAGKWITVTTGETSQNYSLENGATLTGLDASSTFEIYTPDISTATINLEYNTANITSVRHDGKNLTETTEYTVQYTDADDNVIEKPGLTDYGSYHVTVTGAGKYSGSVTKDFSIVKVQQYNVTLSDDNGHSKAYNNTELDLTINYRDFRKVLEREWGYEDYSFMIWDNIVINADTKSLNVEYRDYSSGSSSSGQMTIYVNVEKLQSTVTTAPTALENLTANGSAQALLDTSNAAAENGTLYYALGTDNETAPTSGWSSATAPTETAAGTYYVWYKAVGNNGFADTEPVCLTVEIAPNTITLTAENITIADFTYDGTENTPVLRYGDTALVKDTDYELLTTEGDTASATNAGTYTIHINGKGDYAGENIALTWKINKADVTVTADAISKTYGKDDPKLTYTAGALFGTDAFTGALARAEGEAVNTYAITQGTLSAGDNYNIKFTGADFTINKADSTPDAVTGLTAAYGKTLANVELPDGWAWDAPDTSVGNVGNNTFSATFTPDDTDNYNTYTTDLTVTVTAIPATPVAVAALNATYGDTLADVDLPTPEDGTWAWKDAGTTSVGNAGEQTFKAVFTPSSPNYTAVEQDVTINVAKADPTPDAVTGLTVAYGKKLSDVTLPDGWAWDAPATSVGNVGNNPFAATYTPTDTDNYNTLNQNLTVNVVAVDKTSLNEAIAAANTYLATIQKTVYADPALALISAITDANAISTNDNVTEAQVAQAIIDMNNAVTTAKAAVKDIDDTKAAQAVTDKINALPAVENIKSTDKEAVEAARAAYANLTEAQSAKVTKATTDKLTAAEKAVADRIAADAVIEKINAISEVVLTNESKALIDAARTAYEALATDAQKALVSNYTTLTADEQKYSDLQVADVKAKIDAIGDIELTDESKAAIDTARAAFKALNADQQALVANAKVLDYAEKLYEALDAKDKADKDKAAAEKSAAEALDKATKAETDKAAAETEAAKALDNAAKAAEAQAKAEAEAAAAKAAQATAEKAAADAKTAQTKAEEDAAAAKAAQATAEKAAADAKTAQTKAEEDAAAAKAAQATAEKNAETAKAAQAKAEEDAAAAKTAQATAEKNAETAKAAQATAEKNAEAANSKVSDLTEQLDAAVKQIEELESSGNVNEALKKQVAELKEQLDAAKTAQNEANEALAKAQDVAAAKIAAAEAAQEKAEEEATAAEKAQATAEQTAKEATEKAAAAEKAQATAEQTAKEATEKAAAAEKAQATAEQTAKEATEKAAAAEKAQATAEQNAKEATEKAAAAEEAQKVAEAAQAEAEKKAAEDKAAADQAAADKVIKLIDAIGNVEKTNTSENKIVAARAAYDALTDEQKALVTNYTVLTKAESAYKTLPQTGMSGFHKVFAGLAALMGITGMGLIKKSRKEDEEE